MKQSRSLISRAHMGSKLETTALNYLVEHTLLVLIGLQPKLDKYIFDASLPDRIKIDHSVVVGIVVDFSKNFHERSLFVRF